MTDEDLNTKVSVKLSLSHLLVVWDILSRKLSGAPINKEFTEEEKHAIWALEDLCEQELINNQVNEKPKAEWDALIKKATEHIKSLPIEFLD